MPQPPQLASSAAGVDADLVADAVVAHLAGRVTGLAAAVDAGVGAAVGAAGCRSSAGRWSVGAGEVAGAVVTGGRAVRTRTGGVGAGEALSADEARVVDAAAAAVQRVAGGVRAGAVGACLARAVGAAQVPLVAGGARAAGVAAAAAVQRIGGRCRCRWRCPWCRRCRASRWSRCTAMPSVQVWSRGRRPSCRSRRSWRHRWWCPRSRRRSRWCGVGACSCRCLRRSCRRRRSHRWRRRCRRRRSWRCRCLQIHAVAAAVGAGRRHHAPPSPLGCRAAAAARALCPSLGRPWYVQLLFLFSSVAPGCWCRRCRRRRSCSCRTGCSRSCCRTGCWARRRWSCRCPSCRSGPRRTSWCSCRSG